MSTDIRVVNTDGLMLLIRLAEAYQFNRRPDIEWAEEHLDPEGNHILSLVLFDHQRPAPERPTPRSRWLDLGLRPPERGAGDPVHHRVMVLAKTTGRQDPVEFFLDVPADVWPLLHDANEPQEEVTQ